MLILAVAIAAAVVAAVKILNKPSPTTGYDISFPQCSHDYPSVPLFGIIGVNGGYANKPNPCLGSQLRWAKGAPGLKPPKQPEQPPLSLYINTGNPGAHNVPDWPSGGRAKGYGHCNGKLTNACSFIYGKQRAAYSYRLVDALDPVAAKTAPWWLDVELAASWAGTYKLNIAALKGFLAGLRGAGVTGPIGVYSTSAQWKEITGLTAQTTIATFKVQLRDWVAGTTGTLAQAQQNCTSGGFTGVAPTLAQYQSGNYDADLRCGSKP